MKLTPAEQKICDKYSARDESGFVHCPECPLRVGDGYSIKCYATIDGRTLEAKSLKRMEE